MMKKSFLRHMLPLLLAALLLFAAGCGEEPAAEAQETPDPHAGEVEVPDGAGGTMWVKEADRLSVFGMDRALFSVVGGDVGYSGGGWLLRRGIDVSSYQGDIDWPAVAASGVSFAIIRCGWRGYSGGSLNEDDRFRQNIEGALAAGLDVGVYFYSQAVNEVEAAEEALLTLQLLEGYDVTLPVFFDWEHASGSDVRTEGIGGDTVTDCCLEFCRLVRAGGYTPGVYAYLKLAYFTYDLNRLEGLTVWMGNPGNRPDFYYEHDYWQYSFTGKVPGIEPDTDLDIMFIPLSDGGEK